MRVEYDRELRVGVSSRPFGTLRGLGRRIYWAYTTIATNAREQSLLERRSRHRAWDREHRGATFVGEEYGTEEYGTEDFGGAELGAD
jgi:hypothetical protein